MAVQGASAFLFLEGSVPEGVIPIPGPEFPVFLDLGKPSQSVITVGDACPLPALSIGIGYLPAGWLHAACVTQSAN